MATSTPEAISIVAGETAAASVASGGASTTSGSTGSNGSGGGIPTPIAYALAALAGLGAVAIGGWLMLVRPVKS